MNVIFLLLIMFLGAFSSWSEDIDPFWRRALGGEINSFLVQGPNESLYVIADDRAVHSINRKTGERNWIYRIKGRMESTIIAAPDGTIYVQSDRGELHAVNPGGTLRWRYPMENGPADFFVGAPDGRIIVVWSGGTIESFSRLGRSLWIYTSPGKIRVPPVVGNDGSVWVSGDSGRIERITEDGDLDGEFSAGAAVSEMAVDVLGRIWAGTEAGTLKIFDSEAGGEIPFDNKSENLSAVRAIRTGMDGIGSVFMADGTRMILNPDTNQAEITKVEGIGNLVTVASDGTLYSLAEDGSIVRINPKGEIEASFRGSGAFSDFLLTKDGFLVAAGEKDWILYAWRQGSNFAGFWSGFRGGLERSGSLPFALRGVSRDEVINDMAFFSRELLAQSSDPDRRIKLLTELESFPDFKTMRKKIVGFNLLIEDLLAIRSNNTTDENKGRIRSNADIRARTFLLLGKSDDIRMRFIILDSLRNEDDSWAMAAGFRALGNIGADGDGSSMRFMAKKYQLFEPVQSYLRVETARAMFDLIQYNGGVSDPTGNEILEKLFSGPMTNRVRREVVKALQGIGLR